MHRNPTLKQNARSLRKDQTFEEKHLWDILRNRQLGQWKFRRQYAIEPYIVDFCCVRRRLVVEVDGETHDVRYSQDKQRDESLLNRGFTILRFWNEDIKYQETRVIQSIVNVLCYLEEQRNGIAMVSIGRIIAKSI